MNPTEEFQPLIDQLFVEKVLRARATPPQQRFMEGFELFEEVEARMRAGVRVQFPAADEGEVERILAGRFARLRQVAEHGIYRPVI